MKKSRTLVLVVLMLLLGIGSTAEAHRVGIPLTTLEWHEPSASWHLIHKLSSHDFAASIPEIGDGGLDTREAQEAMARFILSHFQIRGAEDAINFSYLGAEEDADSFWIYFKLTSPDQDILIENGLVLEQADGDTRRHALVNISIGDEVTTLLFAEDDAPKQARLERPSTQP